jgi:hypothetical protein
MLRLGFRIITVGLRPFIGEIAMTARAKVSGRKRAAEATLDADGAAAIAQSFKAKRIKLNNQAHLLIENARHDGVDSRQIPRSDRS